MSGVIPPIFASSLLLFPATIANWFGTSGEFRLAADVAASLGVGQPVHMVLYSTLIIFFLLLFTRPSCSTRARRRRTSRSPGPFIPAIRRASQTAEYIDKVLTRLTCGVPCTSPAWCLLPEILHFPVRVPFYFGGTSL